MQSMTAAGRRLGPPRLQRQRGTLTLPGASTLVILLLAPLLFAFVWSAQRAADDDRERYGSTVVARLAASARESLITGDRIALNVLAREFSELQGVATAAVYGADDRLLAAADASAESPAEFDAALQRQAFAAQITLQDSIAGYARIALDRNEFAADHLPVVGFGLALGALVLAALRFALQPAQAQLNALRERIEALGASPPPAQTSSTTDPASELAVTARPAALYLLVVNLFNQVSLSSAERSEVIEHCEDLLDSVCRLYGGRHERLPGTGLAVVLDASADGDAAFQAVCAALLAGRVFEAVNVERLREDRMPLALRIGLDRLEDTDAKSVLDGQPLADACPDALDRTVTLSALARERTVVIGATVHAQCVQAERIVAEQISSPVLRAVGDDCAWLVRDLAEGYRALLDRQARLLLGPA